jgi:hypothetical protein
MAFIGQRVRIHKSKAAMAATRQHGITGDDVLTIAKNYNEEPAEAGAYGVILGLDWTNVHGAYKYVAVYDYRLQCCACNQRLDKCQCVSPENSETPAGSCGAVMSVSGSASLTRPPSSDYSLKVWLVVVVTATIIAIIVTTLGQAVIK